jgi:hypothetical protein
MSASLPLAGLKSKWNKRGDGGHNVIRYLSSPAVAQIGRVHGQTGGGENDRNPDYSMHDAFGQARNPSTWHGEMKSPSRMKRLHDCRGPTILNSSSSFSMFKGLT